MGKRGFKDEEQEAADLERRASEKRAKTAHSKVVAILKKHPEANEKALKHLASLGFSAETESSKAPLSRAACSVLERQETKKTAESQSHPTLPKEFASSDPSDLVPAKADSFDGLTAPLITGHCLSAVEPGTLSTSNLRSMILKKDSSIDSAKNEYLRLNEFSSGKDKMFRLAGRFRVWRLLEDELRLQAKWRGRRCKDVTLPMKWPIDGIYLPVKNGDSSIAIKLNATGLAKLVPKSKMPDHWRMEDLHIEYNWSEVRAALYFTLGTDGTPFKIVELFPDVIDHILPEYHEEYSRTVKQQQHNFNVLKDAPEAERPSRASSASIAKQEGHAQDTKTTGDDASSVKQDDPAKKTDEPDLVDETGAPAPAPEEDTEESKPSQAA